LTPKAYANTSRPGGSIPIDLNGEYGIDALEKETTTYFEFLLGDEHSAALFRGRDKNVERHTSFDQATFRDVSEALSGNCILSKELDEHLQQWGETFLSLSFSDTCIKKSLDAMSTVKRLYSDLPDTAVALEVIH